MSLNNLANYGPYANLVRTSRIIIQADQITNMNWKSHYDGIINILKDGIELNYVQNLMVTVDFGNGEKIDLHINDYLINLLFWYLIVALGDMKVGPQHLFFEDRMTRKAIKGYVDKHFVIPRKGKVDNKTLNNIIADFLYNFVEVDNFSMYLANTLNLEDSIELMNACQEYDQILHSDLSDVPLENVKNRGMELVHQAQRIIMEAEKWIGHEHCLRSPFASDEGISPKQYKDNSINIGTKPDGQGSIYHEKINQSYITGGLNKLMYQYIDSASARVAQIISKKNVGDSGGFARILGLNNVNTFLHPDPTFDCGSNNYVTQLIPNADVLKMLQGRYYKLHPQGQLLRIGLDDSFLIGKTVLLRSPIFCASYASGHGICYHCYGDLAYTNSDINIGRIATEIVTSQYTQKRLSAKHLLEAKVKVINWCEDFSRFFSIDINSIQVRHDMDYTSIQGWKLVLSFADIQLENEDDFYRHDFYMDGANSTIDEGPFYNEFVTSFNVVSSDGQTVYTITSSVEEEDYDDDSSTAAKMYITNQFSDVIRKSLSIDDESNIIEIPLNDLVGINIFLLKMENNDLGKNLDMFDDLINKKDVTKSFNIDELVSRLQLNVIKGGIHCASIHLEVMMSNQVRNANDRLLMPNWYNFNEPYELLTLNEALKDNPSPIISLTYCKLADALKYPLSFKKSGSSIFDLFYIRKPKKFLNADHEILDIPNQTGIKPGESPIVYFKDHNDSHPPVDIRKYLQKFSQTPRTRLDD